MRKEELTDLIKLFTADNQENLMTAKDAIDPSLAGMKVYDEPLVGFARADDELFVKEFKKEGVIHPEYLSPCQWLPGAKTVISFFLPFTAGVKRSNRNRTDEPYEPGIPQRCSTLRLRQVSDRRSPQKSENSGSHLIHTSGHRMFFSEQI